MNYQKQSLPEELATSVFLTVSMCEVGFGMAQMFAATWLGMMDQYDHNKHTTSKGIPMIHCQYTQSGT